MGRFVAFLLGLAGAVLASQGPGFTLQYMQNLQGRVDEMRPIVIEFETNVAQYGYTRATAMSECATAEGLLDALCTSYRTTVVRFELLDAHLKQLNEASDWVRPLVLARTYYKEIAESVYKQFEPAVPANIHGAAYAAGGFAVLWGGASFFFGLIGSMFGLGRR